MATQTEQVLLIQAETVLKLVLTVREVLAAKNVSDSERDAAKAQTTELVAADVKNAEVAAQINSELLALIDEASAAIPAPTPEPTPEPEPEPTI